MVRAAIREERKLRTDYRDAKSRASIRTVMPLTLTYWIDGIVLGAWCELRVDYRHFRLDRMLACHPSDVVYREEGRRLRLV